MDTDKSCAECAYYIVAKEMHEDNDKCNHPNANYAVGGIRVRPTIEHYSCYSMLKGICQNHKLFRPRDK